MQTRNVKIFDPLENVIVFVRKLRERFNGVPVKHPGKSLWVEPSGAGPNAPGVSYQRRWFD